MSNRFGPNPDETDELGPITVTRREDTPYQGSLQQALEQFQSSNGAPTTFVAAASPPGFNQFSVDQFKSRFLEVGLVTPSNFLVKFTPPPSIFNKPEDATAFQDVPYLCGATSLPGMRIATSALRRYNYGNIIKMPYDMITEDIELTFYVDASQAKSLDLFHTWMRKIIDIGRDFPSGNAEKTNLVSYQSEYICPELKIFIVSQLKGTEIVKEHPPSGTQTAANIAAEQAAATAEAAERGTRDYDPSSYAIVECTLYDVFPIGISNIVLDWGEADTFARINVSFSYRTHEFIHGKFAGFKNGEAKYSDKSVSTSVKLGEKDFLTSLVDFLGKVADTKRKIQRFKTDFKTFQNAKGGLAKLTALGNLAGPGSALNTTANQLNTIVNQFNFITGNGTSKRRSGTKKVISTLP